MLRVTLGSTQGILLHSLIECQQNLDACSVSDGRIFVKAGEGSINGTFHRAKFK